MIGNPSLSEFDPTIIPYQLEVIKYVRNFDYKKGILEVLLSGSYGSAKSCVMAHVALTHVLMNPGSRLLLGRKTMPDLKDTILQKIIDHIGTDLKEGHDYEFNRTKSSFHFRNGSMILSRSWSDKKYKKLRSLELSAAIIEELTENNSDEFEGFYKELIARVGRIPGIRENFIMSATNPDSPSHSAYDYFIRKKSPNRKVFYSRTDENPFLPKTYIETLKETLTEQECRRYIGGEWISIRKKNIYYAYDPEMSLIDTYEVNPRLPIYFSFDFNIGDNKPMSACFSQVVNGNFYFFDEIILDTARTLDVLEEANGRNLLDYPGPYFIHGDASGRHRDTRSIKSDYQLIEKFFSQMENKYGPINCRIDVPLSNPPLRTRHTIANGQMKNAYGKTHVFIVRDKCPTLDKGFRNVTFKKNAGYIEEETREQHVTTAATYHICRVINGQYNKSAFRSNRAI